MGANVEAILMNDPHSYPHRPSRLLPKDQLIMGIHAIREVLLHAPKRLIRVFTEKARKAGRKSELVDLCEQKGIPVSLVSFETLTHMVGSDSHQSFIAHIRGREFYSVKEFLKKTENEKQALVLMLDQIFDPQNFGALLRSAECFGVSGVAWSKNRGCDLTPVAAKASCGASELISLIRTANLAEAVSQFQARGFEAVVAVLDPKSENALQSQFAPKTLLIVGSEGEGIQPLIRKRSDRSIFIPMKGKLESLNVSQATAILLSCIN